MAYSRNVPAGLIAVGFQTISCANSTAIALTSTAAKNATCMLLSVETNNARVRMDGTAPALTTGVLLLQDIYYFDALPTPATTVKFQRQTGTSKISVQLFRHPSDQVV